MPGVGWGASSSAEFRRAAPVAQQSREYRLCLPIRGFEAVSPRCGPVDAHHAPWQHGRAFDAVLTYRLVPRSSLFGRSMRRTLMAKALLGHVGVGTDMRLAAEVRRLRARVRDLEAALEHAQAVNEALAAQVD